MTSCVCWQQIKNTKSNIEEVCLGATVLDGLAIQGSKAQNEQDEVKSIVMDWLNELGFKK